MLFQIEKNKKVIINPEAVRLAPKLRDLTEQEILFIILAFDYHSPSHQFPEQERIRRANRYIFGKDDYDYKHLEAAIKQYNSLQYDSKRETIKAYQTRIKSLQQEVLNCDVKKINDFDVAIERLEKRCSDLQKEVDADEEIAQLKGGGQKTFIERWQENQKKFKQDEEYRKERTGIAEL